MCVVCVYMSLVLIDSATPQTAATSFLCSWVFPGIYTILPFTHTYTHTHTELTLLQLQEQQTIGRPKSLEALIRQLKLENCVSEENVKIIENHFTT